MQFTLSGRRSGSRPSRSCTSSCSTSAISYTTENLSSRRTPRSTLSTQLLDLPSRSAKTCWDIPRRAYPQRPTAHPEAAMFPSRPLRRAVLRRAATRYAEHGWDVVPGACLAGDRFVCDEAGCHAVTCHPASASWEAAAGHDTATVRAAWRRRPYGVLLASGRGVDALEVTAGLGRFALGQAQGPVAVAPSGRWVFLV